MSEHEANVSQETVKKKKRKNKSSKKQVISNTQEQEEEEIPSSPSTPTAIFYSFPSWGYGAPTTIAYMGTFDSGKYKTKLCRHWKAGYCLFGASCCFAHVFDDIQPPNSLASQRSPVPNVTYLSVPVPSQQFPGGSTQHNMMPPSPLIGMPPLLPTDLLMSPVMPSMPPSYGIRQQPEQEEYEEEYQAYGEYEQIGDKQEEQTEGKGEQISVEDKEKSTDSIANQMQNLSVEEKEQISGNEKAPLPAQRA